MAATSLNEKYCRICAAASGTSASAEYDNPWLEAEDYLAFASIGAMVPGWSLIFPKKHQLNLARDVESTEFWSFASHAYDAVTREFGRSVIFEHGPQHENSATGCGTDHAHLHIVPLSFSLIEAAKAFDPSVHWSACKAQDLSGVIKGREYLFVSEAFNGDATEGYVAILATGRSQFFRRVIADKLGCPLEFDYKLHRFEAIANSTALTLRASVRGMQAAAA